MMAVWFNPDSLVPNPSIHAAVWFNPDSLVPSPSIHIHKDGTQVTNFPESLALWANVNDAHRTPMIDCAERKCNTCTLDSLPFP